MTSLPNDVFAVQQPDEHPRLVSWHYSEQLNNEENGETVDGVPQGEIIARVARLVGANGQFRYFLFSHGPDLEHQDSLILGDDEQAVQYDPTNGTISKGDIYYMGPGGLR
jgi:hypothetical protein